MNINESSINALIGSSAWVVEAFQETRVSGILDSGCRGSLNIRAVVSIFWEISYCSGSSPNARAVALLLGL